MAETLKRPHAEDLKLLAGPWQRAFSGLFLVGLLAYAGFSAGGFELYVLTTWTLFVVAAPD